MYKEIIKPALILFLICIVLTAALAYVNHITKPIIEENQRLEEQETLIRVFAEADRFSKEIEADQLRENGFVVPDGVQKLYEAEKDGNLTGYVVVVSTKGYGGDMNILVGIDINQSITGVVITSHNETPGLGDKVTNPDFTDQFKGEIPKKVFSVVQRQASDDNEIEAVASATKSSRAVTDGVADAVAMVRSVIGGD